MSMPENWPDWLVDVVSQLHPLCTKSEVAKAIGVKSKRTVDRLVVSGRLKSVVLCPGGSSRALFPRLEVGRLIAESAGLPARDKPPAKIEIQPDGPALLAQRLVARLKRDGLLGPTLAPARAHEDATVEALADEIHQDVLDATLRGGL